MVFGRRYRVTEKLGSGGMAEVYKAVDETLGRTVAVKVMHPHFTSDPDYVSRFRQEAASAANLQHPAIVNIYDFGIENDTPYIVMEYVRGTDLKTVLKQQGPIDPVKVAEYGVQVCSALAVAHGYGIVHRDIKPHNIVLMPDSRLKVMDFGIARAVDSDATQTGSVLGTAQYVSPEQAQGRMLTGQTDLYSLGVVLYELSTGRLPFDGDTPVSVALKHVNDPVVPPRRINPAIPPALEAVTMKALEKDPARRYRTADEMREELVKVVQGRAVAAPAPTADQTSVMPAVSRTAEVADVRRPQRSRGTSPWLWLGIIALVLLGALGVAWAMQVFGSGVQVPDTTGMTLEQAKAAVLTAELKVGNEDSRPDETVAAGVVIQTEPPAGTQVDKGQIVDITFSSGPQLVKVPKVVGVERLAANKTLQAQGFVVSPDYVDEFSAKFAAGLIISQEPTAGAMVPKGTTIVLTVSKGAEQAIVPDVTGKKKTDASTEVSAAGFKVAVTTKANASVAVGTVYDQSPNGGVTAAKGSIVTIFVSSGPEQVTVPDLTGRTQDQAIQMLTDLDLGSNPLTQTEGDLALTGKVLKQEPLALKKVSKGTVVTFWIAVAP